MNIGALIFRMGFLGILLNYILIIWNPPFKSTARGLRVQGEGLVGFRVPV